MDTMVTIDELQRHADRSNITGLKNKCEAYTILAALRSNSFPMMWGDRKQWICERITYWDNYMMTGNNMGIDGDLMPNDLGSVYRDVAHAYNGMADNLRDESHTTLVDR